MNVNALKINFIQLIICYSFFSFPLSGQEIEYNPENYFTIVSYNVENLFDTINNIQKEDDAFLPNSNKKWNTEKYYKKINDIARVLSSINKNELPELIGLVEVENKNVVKDLIKNKLLKNGSYQIVHEESPDIRGIDVALIFRRSEFQYIKHEMISVCYDFEPETTTRDILYVKGELKNGEILHVFLNHWSSRRGGLKVSEPKRLYAASLVKAKVDSIQKQNKKAKIVIMGDFNDEPSNKSIHEVLLATNNQSSKNKRELYSLMYNQHILGYGTYNYKGNWNMLDNIIVSQSLLYSPGKYEVAIDGANIFYLPWMIYDNVKTGQFIPNKTYGGPNYYGGVSDHFPIYVLLKK